MANDITIPDFNPEIGMDFDLWSKDRGGFRLKRGAEQAAGVAEIVRFGTFSGCEVGEQYQGAMGEDRTETTYTAGMPVVDGDTPGSMGPEGAVKAGEFGSKGSSFSGKSTLRAPQNYRLFSNKR